MTVAPKHLQRVGPASRALTGLTVALAVMAALAYLYWRLTSSLEGAFLPFAILLLLVDAIVVARFLVEAAPGIRFQPDADVAAPTVVPRTDVVVVERGESPADLRLALVAAREIRGTDGLIVIGGNDRPAITDICRAFEVPHVNPESLADLGIEANRPAPFLAILPASVLASPDLVVATAPAFVDPNVGAVSGSTTVHSIVELLGSHGYRTMVDTERLAATLDRAGVAPPLDRPVVFRREALAALGGVDWSCGAPELVAHQRLQRAG